MSNKYQIIKLNHLNAIILLMQLICKYTCREKTWHNMKSFYVHHFKHKYIIFHKIRPFIYVQSVYRMHIKIVIDVIIMTNFNIPIPSMESFLSYFVIQPFSAVLFLVWKNTTSNVFINKQTNGTTMILKLGNMKTYH